MLSTSQRQGCVYTLTNRLMGDPRPDRFEHSEKVRANVRYSPTMPDGVRKPYNRVVKKDRTHQCLEAVNEGYTTVEAIREKIGCAYRTTGDHVGQCARNGWIKLKMIVPIPGGGRVFVYAITEAGRAELERVNK